MIISLNGSDVITLSDLFEAIGLSMDLLTSHESGREDNFLIDLFALLVILPLNYTGTSLYTIQYKMNRFDKKNYM